MHVRCKYIPLTLPGQYWRVYWCMAHAQSCTHALGTIARHRQAPGAYPDRLSSHGEQRGILLEPGCPFPPGLGPGAVLWRSLCRLHLIALPSVAFGRLSDQPMTARPREDKAPIPHEPADFCALRYSPPPACLALIHLVSLAPDKSCSSAPRAPYASPQASSPKLCRP